uniref:E3 ubiquitin-protein ligase TRIM39-like n=1 Tax=Fundulus heteroclitus TaxID=8078 RepID=A0A3Q2NSM0_FUNHE
MASSRDSLSKQLQCSVCQQVFTDPVTTPCGHNFCQACIGQAWDRGDACQCPACDKRFPSRPEMSINTALKELADPLRQMAARPPASAPAAAKPGEVACDVCAVAKQRAEEKRAEELIDELQLEIAELQRRSAELKELEDTDDHLHLLQVSINQTLWTETRIYPELCVGTVRRTLSRLAHTLKKDLDSLKEEEIRRMQKYAVDVVLDPDTAHPNIVLSSDGKQASRGEVPHVVPDNPQRFDPVICVVGKKGFLSGRIYFQVAVGNKTFWDLGVVRESINRKGMITSTPDNGYWTVRLRNGNEYRALDSPSKLLHLQHKPKTVGVFVDYEEGTVSFFDVDARSHIHTFTGCLFSERIFPFFSPGVLDGGKNTEPLIITAVSPED